MILNKNSIVNILKQELPQLQREFGVNRIGLFGSLVKQNSKSVNIDLIIEFQRPIGLRFFTLIDHFENRFKCHVNILTPFGLKSIRIKEIVEKIMKEIEYI